MASKKCDLCGKRGYYLYYSKIVLKTGLDIDGAEYSLCAPCSKGMRRMLDDGSMLDAIAAQE